MPAARDRGRASVGLGGFVETKASLRQAQDQAWANRACSQSACGMSVERAWIIYDLPSQRGRPTRYEASWTLTR